MGVLSLLGQLAAQTVTPAAQAGVDALNTHIQRGGDLLARLQQIILAQKDVPVRRFHGGHQRPDKVGGIGGSAVKLSQLAERFGQAVVQRHRLAAAQGVVAVDALVARRDNEPRPQRRGGALQLGRIAPERNKDIGYAFLPVAGILRQDAVQHRLYQRRVGKHGCLQALLRLCLQQSGQFPVLHGWFLLFVGSDYIDPGGRRNLTDLLKMPSPEGEGGPAGPDEGRVRCDCPFPGCRGTPAPHQSAGGAADSFPRGGSLSRVQKNRRRFHSVCRFCFTALPAA